jgi:hypothetical protein
VLTELEKTIKHGAARRPPGKIRGKPSTALPRFPLVVASLAKPSGTAAGIAAPPISSP